MYINIISYCTIYIYVNSGIWNLNRLHACQYMQNPIKLKYFCGGQWFIGYRMPQNHVLAVTRVELYSHPNALINVDSGV